MASSFEIASGDVKRVVVALRTIFRGRADDFVRTDCRADGTTTTRRRVGTPFTEIHVANHVRGGYSVGPYILSPDILDGKGCYFGCIDIDRFDPTAKLGAQDVYWELLDLGFTPFIERSKSWRWHVWVAFEEPVLATDLRKILNKYADQILKKHELYQLDKDDVTRFKLDSKKRKISAVEVFPKQDLLGGRTKWGSAVQLPLNGTHLKRGGTALIDPSVWEPIEDQATALIDVVMSPHEIVAKIAAKIPAPPKPKRKTRKKRPHQQGDPWLEIRAKIDLGEYIAKVTDQVGKRAGAGLLFVCPFHGDSEPSLSVNSDEGVWKCHGGGCDAQGDLFHFHERFYDVGKRKALEELAEIAGVELDRKGERDVRKNERRGNRNGNKSKSSRSSQARGGVDTRSREHPDEHDGIASPPAYDSRRDPLGPDRPGRKGGVDDGVLQEGNRSNDGTVPDVLHGEVRGQRGQADDSGTGSCLDGDGEDNGSESNIHHNDQPSRADTKGGRGIDGRGGSRKEIQDLVSEDGRTRHPNAPGKPTEEVLYKYIVSRKGPNFVWRDGASAYSERDEFIYTSGMFNRLCQSKPVLLKILKDSEEFDQLDRTQKLRTKLELASKVAKRASGPVYLRVLQGLPERAEIDGVTRAEQSQLVAELKAAITHPFRFEFEVGSGPTTMSVLAFAESEKVGDKIWRRMGSYAAWAKAGPRIAIRADFLCQYLGLKKSAFKSRTAGIELRRLGVITMDYTIDRETKGWRIRDEWIEVEFDITVGRAEDGHPRLAAADAELASKEKEDEDAPF